MWPFSSKRRTEAEERLARQAQLEIELEEKARKELQDFAAIGDTFQYLDTTFCVTGHSKWLGSIWVPPSPALVCDYIDKQGVLHHGVAFYPHELTALRNQNPDRVKAKE